jgi:hypothetical protein
MTANPTYSNLPKHGIRLGCKCISGISDDEKEHEPEGELLACVQYEWLCVEDDESEQPGLAAGAAWVTLLGGW